MINEFKVHNLWPTPIYSSTLPVREKWKVLIKGIPYERTHINNSDISTDRYLLNSMPELKKEIEIHCENYVRKYLRIKNKQTFYLTNSWCNIHGPNEQSQIHYHANSLLSGVYYPIFPKDSGNISFHRNISNYNIFNDIIKFEYEEYNNITAEQYVIDLKEGTIVIFPSHVEHKVQKNNSNENRYSIAFNFFARGTFGEEEYILEIK